MYIGELAKKTGCRVVTIRYYEHEGLLARPERTEGNYRIYGREDLERLEFVMHCRRHGMKRDEIKKLLAFRDKPHHDCTWVTDLISTHITAVDAQMHSLAHLRQHLEALRQRCAGGRDGTTCGIMQGLDSEPAHCEGCTRRPACPPNPNH